MHTVDLNIKNLQGRVVYDKTHTGPACWKELTREQLLYWAAAMGTNLKLDNARMYLAFLLFGIPHKVTRYLHKADCMQIGDKIRWMFKKNLLHNWLIPVVYHRAFKYHGPKSSLANLTVKEYQLTELCYDQYGITKETGYLDTLAAILYRPRRFFRIDDDIRVALTNRGYVKRAKRFKTLSPAFKHAIYLNYEGCRNHIIDRNPDVFSVKKTGAKAIKTITPWNKIVESAAGGKFGTMRETKESNLHEFLSELGARIRENRELEKNNRGN